MTARLLTRKDLALILGVSVDIIRHNEVRLGLIKYRVRVNKRLIFFRRAEALAELREMGLLR